MTKEETEKYADNMTYRDAINNLMKAKSIPYRKATFIKVNELLKALDQEPCDDAISRQYLLDNCVVDKVTMPYVPVSKIENAPPVTPQPKIGHWKHDKCDVCGASRPPLFDNYCPNCGAKMEIGKGRKIPMYPSDSWRCNK